jgi:hypothetical protein
MTEETSLGGVPLSKLSLAELVNAQQGAQALADRYESRVLAIADEINRRVSPTATNGLQHQGKDYGTITFESGGLKFRGTARKEVKWNSESLRAIAASLPWSRVVELFKIEFSVPEKSYAAVIDPDLLAKLDAARTTKIGAMKVSYVGDDV